MSEWLDPQPIEVPEALRQAVGGHPLVAEMLARRGLDDPQQALAFLDPAHYQPSPPEALPGLSQAVDRLARAIDRGERILVWGDFDVDGLTSTAILVENLQALGAHVTHHVPGRGDGHGVRLETLQSLLARNPVRVVLTCDTGVGALTPVAHARSLGIDFVITDHHALPPELPAAHALVNPCFLPDDHPLRTLPGAGCAYLVAAALAAKSGLDGVERSQDLLALAIVADVATLQGDTRYYLQRGLARLRIGERLGLGALCEVAGVDVQGLDEEHLGFALAPRLNALGRLSDAAAGVELFLTGDLTRARTIAAEMEGLNSRRQLLTSQVLQAAREQIERDPATRRSPLLFAWHATWPPGIVGLVAGRLCERYGKPAVILSTPADGPARGSARSVPGIDIGAAIASASDLLISHGGHPMAAGLSLHPAHLPELRRRLQAEVAQRAAAAPPQPPLAIDAYLDLPSISLELAHELNRLAPFGPGNPPVCLAARRLRVAAQAAVGRTGEHRRLYLQDGAGHEQVVFWWQAADQLAPEGIFDLAYTIRPSNYRGREEVAVQWLTARVVEPAPATLITPGPSYQVFDHRDDPAPELTLEALQSTSPLLVWAEGLEPPGVPAVRRQAVAPAQSLAVWTAPPGPLELADILRRAQPQRVHLFVLDPGLDEPTVFLRQLAGLLKYAVAHYDGRVDEELLERMAAQTAQRAATVRSGLGYLAARGRIGLAETEEGWQVTLESGATDAPAAREAYEHLCQLLRETAAYRAYACRAEPHALLAVAAGPVGVGEEAPEGRARSTC